MLTHANYPAGCHEVAVAATAANGFAADDTFGVFCTLAIDSQNPSGFVGSCTLGPVSANVIQISGDATAADNLESACDNYSAERGLTGTALPAAAADVAGGVPISDAGGLDLDTKRILMIQWIKRFFGKKKTEPITDRPAPLRYYARILQNFAMLKSGDLTREEKARYKGDIKIRQARLIKAGYPAPQNMEDARQMLGKLADTYEEAVHNGH